MEDNKIFMWLVVVYTVLIVTVIVLLLVLAPEVVYTVAMVAFFGILCSLYFGSNK